MSLAKRLTNIDVGTIATIPMKKQNINRILNWKFNGPNKACCKQIRFAGKKCAIKC